MTVEWRLIDEFQQRYGAQAAFERARDFMFAYISQVQAPLPPLASHGMEVARKFRVGAATPEERTRAQAAVWEHISERHAWRDLSPEYTIIRAVTLLVRDEVGPGEESITQLLREALYMVDKFEDHSDSASVLVQQFFFRPG